MVSRAMVYGDLDEPEASPDGESKWRTRPCAPQVLGYRLIAGELQAARQSGQRAPGVGPLPRPPHLVDHHP